MEQPPASTLSGVPPETLPDEAPQGKIEMVFRFWGGNGRGAETGEGGAIHGHHPGLLALIEDAVASKRGALLSPQEFLYISRLKRPADALVVSRQVQLGLEGFRARHGSGPVAVSVVIDAAAGERAGGAETKEPAAATQEPPHDLVTLLKLSKPAQILLTHDLCQQVTAIKGLPLRSFPARFGVYEYLWTAEEKLELLQSEPQLTLAALPVAQTVKEKNGAGGPVTGSIAGPSVGTTKAFDAPAIPVAEVPAKRGLPRAYIFGGVGLAAVILLAAIGLHVMQNPAASSPASDAAPSQIAAPATHNPASGSPASVGQPARQSSAQLAPKGHSAPLKSDAVLKPVAAPTPAPAADVKPAAPSAECTLGGDTSRYVGLAEQARGHGDYANAVRIFREVLACDPNNAAAREGLEKATQGQQQTQ
jgi:hypothetical protein